MNDASVAQISEVISGRVVALGPAYRCAPVGYAVRAMIPYGGAYAGPREVHYLFVDGGALRGRLQNLSNRFFGGVALTIDSSTVAGIYTKVFYYDALPVREDGEAEKDYEMRVKPQKDMLDAVASVDRVRVYEGDARRRRKRGLEQKKVDVMLTVDMLTHAFRKKHASGDSANGDNDFKPLIDALVQDGLFVTLMYPPDETSRELMQAADARTPWTMLMIKDWLTVESKRLFTVPTYQSFHASVPSGPLVMSWKQVGKDYALHKENDLYVVWQYSDPLRGMQIVHKDLELLKYFCSESLQIRVPEGRA
jgi:NYN domain